MKAWTLQDIGEIIYTDVPVPEPREAEVLVRVKAAGICGSDIPRIYRDGAHKMPLIPGHEFSGEIKGIGAGVDNRLMDKRVGVFPLIPCGRCAACRKEEYEICRNYSYLGSRRNGGFAEYAAVPAANLIELPDTVSFETAAMLEPMAVAVHGMRRVSPCSGDKITVCGLGTIGLLLVMILKKVGFKHVYVIGNKGTQREAALRLGILDDCYFDSGKEDPEQWLMEKTDGMGADVFFECVGKNETIAQAINLTAVSGKVCLVGNPRSDVDIPKSVYWKILRNQLVVTGTWNSSFTGKANDDWKYALEKLSSCKEAQEIIITHRFPMEELGKGLRIMRDKTEEYIKIMGVYQ